jgi:hypothetical protein
MPMSLFEWTVRMAMLVVAGLVTLAILGSIHAMSTNAGTSDFPAERVLAPAPSPSEVSPPSSPQSPREAVPDTGRTGGEPAAAGGTGTIVAAPPPSERPHRWLEAIAYALLGLAGLFTIGLILLWQLLRQLRRIADAAESPARNL